MTRFSLLVVFVMTAGCCPTYEFRTYEHEPTDHLMYHIDESSFDGALADYSAGGVLIAPHFREDDKRDGSKSRNASVHLYSKKPTSIQITKVILETEGGDKRLTYAFETKVEIEGRIYQKPFATTAIKLHERATRENPKAKGEDLVEVWGAKTLKLHVWVEGAKEKEKKITFDLKWESHRDIAWPT